MATFRTTRQVSVLLLKTLCKSQARLQHAQTRVLNHSVSGCNDITKQSVELRRNLHESRRTESDATTVSSALLSAQYVNEKHECQEKEVTAKIRHEKMDEYTNFYTKFTTSKDIFGRPLVLLLTWLSASDKHMAKFREYYFKLGFNVVTLQTSPKSLLFPAIGIKSCRALATWLDDPRRQEQKIFVHTFSAGTYVYTQFIRQLLIAGDNKLAIVDRIVAQFHDCPFLDVPTVDNAIQNITPLKFLGLPKLTKALAKFYLYKLCYEQSTWEYYNTLTYFNQNRMKIPTFVMYSSEDPIAVRPAIEQTLLCLRNSGTPVDTKVWPDNGHVQSYRKHKEEYKLLLNEFIRTSNVLN